VAVTAVGTEVTMTDDGTEEETAMLLLREDVSSWGVANEKVWNINNQPLLVELKPQHWWSVKQVLNVTDVNDNEQDTHISC